MVQSGFQNLTFRNRNGILTEQGNKNLTFGETVHAIAEVLVRKDLREPANWNILFDLLCILCIVILCVCATPKEFPVWICVIVMLAFIGLCFRWITYVYSRKK